MNIILLLFFALPVAISILSIIFETLIKCPIKIAGITFAILLIITFTVADERFLIFAILYTILSFIVAWITRQWGCDRRDTDDRRRDDGCSDRDRRRRENDCCDNDRRRRGNECCDDDRRRRDNDCCDDDRTRRENECIADRLRRDNICLEERIRQNNEEIIRNQNSQMRNNCGCRRR